MSENKISEMMKDIIESISSIAGSDTIVGEPINTTRGTVIIPVSKVTIGFATGGVDYVPSATKKDKETSQKVPSANHVNPYFGGGGGTGITVLPLCFIVVYSDGRVELLNITNPAAVPASVGLVDSITNFAEKTPDLITRLKNAFSKKNTRDLDDELLKKNISDMEEKSAKENG